MNPQTLSAVPSVEQSATDALYDQYVLGNYARAAINLVRGRGTRVWDDTGRGYLDFTSGIAVCALGHSHPRWVETVQRQAAELVHVSNLFRTPNQGELARRLVQRAGPGRVFFCNSGAEANEALLKLARLHGRRLSGGVEGKRYKVLCAKNAFHGRTFGGMSATPQEKIQGGFRPLVPGFAFGELNDLESFRALVDAETAAIFVETVQGEGGIHACTTEFLQGLRRLCDEHRLLLLLDEVQCGVGRSGRFFAFEHHGVMPDAIGMAKGLGGGFPIGAVWIGTGCADLFTAGSHGTTFGGTPLACAAALAVLEIIEQEGLLEHVARTSPVLHAGLANLRDEFPALVRSIRGLGFMAGIELAVEPPPVVARLREAGLLCPAAGGNVIRLLPPLNTTADEIAEAVEIFRKVFASF
ncbi:acetylornithine transaminase [Opitutales bacterium ASA1]|uniref:aspartate aminotransferase family protein n=1 Tax=Congregicoccus parvus TaxID=3081749 RepID=UPI002B325AEB|nr:acetylornithine transaminase [Opitutales bacterium ASA1]